MRLRGAFLVALLGSLTLADATEPRIFCEYEVSQIWRNVTRPKMEISEIDPTLCTHLIGTNIGITEDGGVLFDDDSGSVSKDGRYGDIRELSALRKNNPELKLLGSRRAHWRRFYYTYAKVMVDATLRSNYVKNVLDFLLRHGLDGFEFELQFAVSNVDYGTQNRNHVLLFKEFRQTFDKYKLIFCASIVADGQFGTNAIHIPELWEYPHFVNIIWTFNDRSYYQNLTTWHSAPLYPASWEEETARFFNVNTTVRYWLDNGVPAEKIVVGITSYGAAYNLLDSAQHVPGSLVIARSESSDGVKRVSEALRFSEICKLTSQHSWTSVWDEKQRVPYAFSGSQWISFDNVESVEEKAQFVKALGFGGIRFSTVNADDYLGLCGVKYPLLKAVNRVLRDAQSTNFDEDAKRRCGMYNHKYIRHPVNCAKFWICQKIRGQDFNAEPFSCGKGLYFDTNKEACEKSYLADCS